MSILKWNNGIEKPSSLIKGSNSIADYNNGSVVFDDIKMFLFKGMTILDLSFNEALYKKIDDYLMGDFLYIAFNSNKTYRDDNYSLNFKSDNLIVFYNSFQSTIMEKNKFDLIINGLIYSTVDFSSEYINKIYNILKPEGVFLFKKFLFINGKHKAFMKYISRNPYFHNKIFSISKRKLIKLFKKFEIDIKMIGNAVSFFTLDEIGLIQEFCDRNGLEVRKRDAILFRIKLMKLTVKKIKV